MNTDNPARNPSTDSNNNDDQYDLEARVAREVAWARVRGLALARGERPERILGKRGPMSIERWMDHPRLWRPAIPDPTLSRGRRYRPTLFTCAPYGVSDAERVEIAKFCAAHGFAFKIYEDEAAIAAGFYGFGTTHVEIWRAGAVGGACR